MGTDHKNSSSKVKKPELIPLKALVVIELRMVMVKIQKIYYLKYIINPPFTEPRRSSGTIRPP